MVKRFVILPALLLSVLALSACGNTMNGVGRDFEEWGQGLQETF